MTDLRRLFRFSTASILEELHSLFVEWREGVRCGLARGDYRHDVAFFLLVWATEMRDRGSHLLKRCLCLRHGETGDGWWGGLLGGLGGRVLGVTARGGPGGCIGGVGGRRRVVG